MHPTEERVTEERRMRTDEQQSEAALRDDGVQPETTPRDDGAERRSTEMSGSTETAVDSAALDRPEGFADQASHDRIPDGSTDRTEVLVAEPAHDRTEALADRERTGAWSEERSDAAWSEERTPAATGTTAADDADAQLFGDQDTEGFRARWVTLQGSFVDDPRQAVQQADELVNEVMQALTSQLTARKEQIEGRSSEESTDTEELRLRLRGYRAFFELMLKH